MRGFSLRSALLLLAACGSPRGAAVRAAAPAPTASEAPPAPTAATAEVPTEAPVSAPERPVDRFAERVLGQCPEGVAKDGGPTGKGARFLLLHTNDLQARYSEKLGGKSRFSRLAGALAAERATTPNVLVLDAGDAYEKGSYAETLSSGEATREALQLLPLDARVIGNHDFAWGREQVLRDVTQSRYPVLASNIQYVPVEGQPPPENPFLPYVRFRVGCVRVAVLGLVTAGFDARDEQIKGPYDTVFLHDDRYATVAKALVDKLRPDADVIIALDHLGLFPDSQLAQRVPGIDIVISSHTEEFLERPNPVWRADGRTGYLVEAGHWTRAFGRGTVVVGPKGVSFEGYKLVRLTEQSPVDEDVEKGIAAIEAKYAPTLHEPLVTVGKTIPVTDLPALVRDALRSEEGVDGLLIGGDTFFGPIAKGPATPQSLFETFFVQREPAGTSGFTSLWKGTFTGAQLLDLKNRVRGGNLRLFLPSPLVKDANYSIGISKRVREHPNVFFTAPPPLPATSFVGEQIDVVLRYAKTRAAAGKTLDGP